MNYFILAIIADEKKTLGIMRALNLEIAKFNEKIFHSMKLPADGDDFKFAFLCLDWRVKFSPN